eukprot:2783226-Rhodomonas_salina.1
MALIKLKMKISKWKKRAAGQSRDAGQLCDVRYPAGGFTVARACAEMAGPDLASGRICRGASHRSDF